MGRWGHEYLAVEAVRECLPDRARLLSYFAGITEKCVSVANSTLHK
jgi:glutathione S-transferase